MKESIIKWFRDNIVAEDPEPEYSVLDKVGGVPSE